VDFDSVVDELYGLAPDDFTATRDERVREARATKDRDLASKIKSLRRPSVAAWAINITARENAQPIRAVLALGTDLRTAQDDGTGDLRRLLGARADVVAEALQAIRQTADAHQRPLSESGAAEVEQTLRAAMAEDGVGRAVRAGRLTATVTTAVLAGLDLSTVAAPPPRSTAGEVASSADSPARAGTSADPRDGRRIATAKAREQARRAAAAARRALDAAQAAVKRAESDAAAADDRVARLRRDLEVAEMHAAEAIAARDRAIELAHDAELALADAEADAAAAERATRTGGETN
jgi:hypothetical protein